VENLFNELGIHDIQYKSDIKPAFLHPGRSCTVVAGGKEIGILGEIHPDVTKEMDINPRAIVFDLDLDMLLNLFSETKEYRDIPKVPSASRDVAFIVATTIESEKILSLALEQKEELLENIGIFDVYVGKGIPEGSKSIAVRFTYRSSSRTLTDSEVSEVHNRIVRSIIDATGALIRGMESEGWEQ